MTRPPTVTAIVGALRDWRDELAAAAIFLTRLPIGWRGPWPADLPARSVRAFPLIGAFVGLAGGAAFWLAAALGLPPTLAALAAVAAQLLLTGGLHEDGLADVADGLGGGRDRSAKLAIMRDSRVGSYGVLALLLALLARVLAPAALAAPAAAATALIAAGAASRAAIPLVMLGGQPARSDGLAASHGAPSPGRAAVAAVLAAGLALLLLGPGTGAVALLAGGAAAAALAWIARRQIGGYTGDVLGATQQVVEIAMLLAVVALR